MLEEISHLNEYIDAIDEEWGGDIDFRSPVSENHLNELEIVLNYRLPEIFRWLYTKKTNGLQVDNRSVLGVYDHQNRKTFVENINRFNDPSKNLYFKDRPEIFNDYVIVGYEHKNLVCISKKYDFTDPLLYSCPEPNNPKGVDFYCMDINLLGFIKKIVYEVFENETKSDNWILK